MSPDPDLHESADAWLDDAQHEGQGRILQEILRDKPGAAREFAALARTHAALELASFHEEERLQRTALLLKPLESARWLRFLRQPAAKWTAAAVLTLLGSLWAMGQFSKIPSGSSSQPGTAQVLRPRSQPAALTPVAQLPPADPVYGKFMESFLIPEFKATGLGLSEAIALLTDHVAAAGHGTFQVEIEETPPEEAAATVHLNLKYQPAATLLHLIALQTGMKVYPTGTLWRIRQGPVPDAPPPSGMIVSLERWDSFLESQGLAKIIPSATPRPTGGMVGHESGRGFETPAVAPELPDLKSVTTVLLAALHEAPGMVEQAQEPGRRSSDKAIRIAASPKLHAMLALLLSGPVAPGTFSYDLKWVSIPDQATLQQILASLPDAESITRTGGMTLIPERLMPELLEALIAHPSIKLETGAPLRLAPGNTVTALDTTSPDAAIADSTWTGRMSRITSRPQGSGIQCEVLVKHQALNPDGSLAVTEQNSRFTVPQGMTLMPGGTKLAQGELVVFLAARSPDAVPYAIRIPGKPGYVRSPFAVEKGQVDVEGIPAGTKVKCPYTGQTFRVPQ